MEGVSTITLRSSESSGAVNLSACVPRTFLAPFSLQGFIFPSWHCFHLASSDINFISSRLFGVVLRTRQLGEVEKGHGV